MHVLTKTNKMVIYFNYDIIFVIFLIKINKIKYKNGKK